MKGMDINSRLKIFQFIALEFLMLFIFNPSMLAQDDQAEKLFAEIKQTLNVPDVELIIQSVAECTGPEGSYETRVYGDGDNLTFSQIFSYRDESNELSISGDRGTNALGESISEFMIFYGRMHDYVRIALQPEYLLHSVDSVISKPDSIMISGKTDSGYRVEYFTDSKKKPLYFKLYLDDETSLNTWFDEWVLSTQGIKIPKTVRIVDGEKEFIFRYTDISVEEINK
jgi:hypothetical protein